MARKKPSKPESRAAECEEYDPALFAAESEAYAQYRHELIAEFRAYLRKHSDAAKWSGYADWSDDEVWRYLQKQRHPLARAAFAGLPLEGDLPAWSATLRKLAREAVLDTAAANARHTQRSVTRRETAAEVHADIRAALEAEVAKHGGRPMRGDMKRIYSDVALSVTKARKKNGRDGVEMRTVQRVWLEMKKQQ